MSDEILVPAEQAVPVTAGGGRHRWRPSGRRAALVAGASVLALGGIVAATSVTAADPAVTAVSAVQDDATGTSPALAGTGAAPALPRGGATWPGDGAAASSGGASSTQEEAAEASDAESTGIVLIDTELAYQGAEAAGTGMVLTGDGLILTNNHVVEGSTAITVTVAATGETYTATVLGTDPEDDVALLQLDGASGLTTVALDQDGVAAGDAVTAVGNADGGGVLMAADGSVTSLESSVTTQAEYSVAGETLDGMIEFSADVVAGDSGGALLDGDGEVVGMTTAGSTGYIDTVAYAVPIEDALAIVAQIQAGDESDGVVLGYPAFLGVSLASGLELGLLRGTRTGTAASAEGAIIGAVYSGTPAAEAGLAAGDVVTAVDGAAVTGASDLAEALAGHEPGDAVALTWIDGTGATHTATVTLTSGPAV
ncbi:S1C family serine protease [Demequina iriomotensis]|uniref:S1C family serine protease n=1 Tax=Demequina iriomotensis TaxID=1536641 RepID=UPI000781C6F8|nr:trypsin-like peptidase domain-containing protein [Demequina iriomotensis]